LNRSRSKLSFGFGVFGLAVLLAPGTVFIAPSRAAAQQGTPSAAGQAAPASALKADEHAMQGEKPNEAEDEQGDAALLHSPVVKATARMLHLPLDTAMYVMLGLNFAIIFFGIAIPLAKVMPKILRKRSQTLSQDLSEARKATADAQARLSAVEAQLAGLGEEIKKLTAQVEHESAEDEKRIKASIGEESARIVAAAEQEIGAAATQVTRALRSFAADLAIGQAEKQIALTPETDRALIAEFVAGAAGDGKGGRN
jgi:F-type H+-transporting ATPase subunit b